MLSMIPAPVRDDLRLRLNSEIKEFKPTSGGCINHGGHLITDGGDYFVKWNDASRLPGMFETEARGLRHLGETNSIRFNKVVDVGTSGTFQWILLEWISQASKKRNYWTRLGEQLAALHRNSAPEYGLDHDNYIGSLRQINTWEQNWIDFFVRHRIEPQVQLATENRLPIQSLRKKIDGFCLKLPDLLPQEVPALIHGDLWSGNLIVDDKGQPCLIDPAAYFANREAELAYTQLFGGFDREFYRSYQNAFQLQKGWEERIDIYNLYPLLVHVNLFGAGYIRQAEAIVNRFS